MIEKPSVSGRSRIGHLTFPAEKLDNAAWMSCFSMVLPSHQMTARVNVLNSSRMFPVHGCWLRSDFAPAESLGSTLSSPLTNVLFN